MLKRRRKNKENGKAKMDLMPMIDVTFLLLVFFMLASKFKTDEQQLLVHLPNDGISPSVGEPEERTRIYVNWCRPGTYQASTDSRLGRPVIKVGTASTGFRRLERNGRPHYPALVQYLRQLKKEARMRKKGPPVIVDGNELVPWRHVMKVLDSAVEAGVTDLTIAARGRPIPR